MATNDDGDRVGRRQLVRGAASAAGLALVASCAHHEESGEADVTPGEDLMQEHGLVERLLLVYDECARRIDAGSELDVAVVVRAASIVQRFVHDYHERDEERFVFPRLLHAGRETALVGTLLHQHERGRTVTATIVGAMAATPELAGALRSFSRMYRPHAAREDTVVFPAFRDVLSAREYHELGERFEEREHQLFGERGFERMVTNVAAIEGELGIDDLASFTP